MNFKKLFNLKSVVFGLLLAVVSVLGFNFVSQNVVYALPKDCEDNSIIWCGFQNLGEFQNKYNQNAKGDLKNLYAHPFMSNVASSGMTEAELGRFMNEGKFGYVYRNGDIFVDNQKVVTGAWSLGRKHNNKPGRQPIQVAGVTYYTSPTHISFASTTERIPVFVLFNDDGEVEFAVINSCGNPTWGNSVKPKYSCDKLKADPIANKKDTYRFTTKATAYDNANIVKVIYDFGDGSPQIERTNKDEDFAFEYQYKKPGNFTAKVSVVVSLPSGKPGGNTKTVTSQACQTPIKVEEEKIPIYKCEELKGKLISGNRKYLFELKAVAKDGAKLKEVDFDFGDNQKALGVKPQVETGNITMSIEHQYASSLSGKVTITTQLKFSVGNEIKTKSCETEINLKKETCEDKPNAEECKPPIEYCKPNIPKGDERCKDVLPAEIVKTGPAELAATLIGTGGLAGAAAYYRASRKNLISKILKR